MVKPAAGSQVVLKRQEGRESVRAATFRRMEAFEMSTIKTGDGVPRANTRCK